MKRGFFPIALVAVLIFSLSGCDSIKERVFPSGETTALFEYIGGNYADFAKNYGKQPPVELRCRFDGEARVEYTISDSETITRVFDALSEITVSGEQTGVYAADDTVVYTFVLDDGSELPIEFNSENLVLSGKREGMYVLENTSSLSAIGFEIQRTGGEQTDAPEPKSEPSAEPAQEPDEEFAAAVKQAIETRKDFTLAVDDGNPLFEEMQVKNILVLADGTGGLELSGKLANTYGDKVRICDRALMGNVFTYGNGGWRVIIFLLEDGSLTILNPNRLYSDEIQVVEQFGGLKRIVAIDEVNDSYATTIVATDIDGNTYLLDEFLVELS